MCACVCMREHPPTGAFQKSQEMLPQQLLTPAAWMDQKYSPATGFSPTHKTRTACSKQEQDARNKGMRKNSWIENTGL